MKFIWINNKKYYLYDVFEKRDRALKTAKYYKKKRKCKYFIIAKRGGLLFPETKYELYLTKVIKLW